MAEDPMQTPEQERREQTDRRVADDPGYPGPDRRKGERRADTPPSD